MLKLILAGLIIYLVFKGCKTLLKARLIMKERTARNDGQPVCYDMVRCVRCGTFIHANSATRQDDSWICTEHLGRSSDFPK